MQDHEQYDSRTLHMRSFRWPPVLLISWVQRQTKESIVSFVVAHLLRIIDFPATPAVSTVSPFSPLISFDTKTDVIWHIFDLLFSFPQQHGGPFGFLWQGRWRSSVMLTLLSSLSSSLPSLGVCQVNTKSVSHQGSDLGTTAFVLPWKAMGKPPFQQSVDVAQWTVSNNSDLVRDF